MYIDKDSFGNYQLMGIDNNALMGLKKMIEEKGSKALVQIDGGVNDKTAPLLVEAGADVLVSGSYIFKAADPIKTIHELKNCK